MKHKRFLIAVSTALVLGLIWTGVAFRYFVRPMIEPERPTEVVYVLGSDGMRTPVAFDLVDRGLADTVVLSATIGADPPECVTGYRGHQVLCVQPYPWTTQGEAMQLARLARQYNWHSVTVVTHQAHITRARVLVQRCYPGETRFVEAGWYRLPVRVWQLFYESLGMAKVAVTPGCDQRLPFVG